MSSENDPTTINRLKDELKHLVLMSSQSHDPEGVNSVQRYIADELKALDFKVELKNSPQNDTGDLLIASFKKKANRKFVTLVCHADTVLGLDKFPEFKVSKDGKRAVGSGVIDDKGGVIVLLEGLRRFLAQNPDFPFHLRVVCSPSEEVGSIGFHKIYSQFAQDSFAVLGFEPALDSGAVINSRRGNRWYQVSVEGKSAHAGRTMGEHVNAAHDLALKISKLTKLNKFKKEMSLNVAEIIAGSPKFNVTAANAECKIDIRYARFEDREFMHRKIVKILTKPSWSFDKKSKSKTSFTIADDCPPFASNQKSKRAVQKLVEIISKIEGRKITAEKAGGAGDVNYMSERNLIVIDGLGPVGGGLHTNDEFVILDTLSTRAQAFSLLLKYFCRLF